MRSTAANKEKEVTSQQQFNYSDPAERTMLRFFYRDRRPTWLGRLNSRLFCCWAYLGLPPRFVVSLGVRDRTSGRMRWDPLVVATVAGRQYIVSMFGAISDWVCNLEAAGGDAVILQGRSHRVHLALVPIEERAPVLREWARIATSGRKHFPLQAGAPLADFTAIAAQYPVYLVQPSK